MNKWQSDPSRIIYHARKYHFWMIDGYLIYPEIERRGRPANGLSWIRYLTSEDGKTWPAVGFVPLGPKGSASGLAIEQANVIMHEGRFYLFSEGLTTNREKYKSMHAGIIGLTADAPEGPWRQVGDLMLSPENDGKFFDMMAVSTRVMCSFRGNGWCRCCSREASDPMSATKRQTQKVRPDASAATSSSALSVVPIFLSRLMGASTRADIPVTGFTLRS